MKALFLDAPGAWAVRDISEPQMGPGDVLLRVRYVGLCGTDLSTFRGKNALVQFPRIPGHEISATIERAGSDVPADLKPRHQRHAPCPTKVAGIARVPPGPFQYLPRKSNSRRAARRSDGGMDRRAVGKGAHFRKTFAARIVLGRAAHCGSARRFARPRHREGHRFW
jgi:hypothetical protein